jgi:hypothetical protein
MTTGWEPNEQTLTQVDDFLTTFLWRLPYLLGIDELLNSCEVINTDPEGVGAGTLPRYVTVTINRYHQMVLYRGSPTVSVGDLVTVAHFRQGDLYEIIGAGGPSGVSPSLPTGVRGDILRRGAATWEAHAAGTDGAAIVGDGTDPGSTTTPTWKGQHTWTTGGIRLLADSLALLLGAGSDMSIDYNGTVGRIITDLVAASDLDIDCGTNKTVRLVVPVYEDLQVSIRNIKPGGTAPTARTYAYGIGGGIAYPTLGFAVGDFVWFDVQTRHAMQLNQILDNHIHFILPNTTNIGDKFQFQLDVIAAGIDTQWAVPAGSPYTGEHTVAANDNTYHRLLEVADIAASNDTVSTLYKCRLERIAATSNEYGSEVYIEFTDCHYPKDTLGSRQEDTK